jgi:hypothetical protein
MMRTGRWTITLVGPRLGSGQMSGMGPGCVHKPVVRSRYDSMKAVNQSSEWSCRLWVSFARFDGAQLTSALTPQAGINADRQHVSKVPICDIERSVELKQAAN